MRMAGQNRRGHNPSIDCSDIKRPNRDSSSSLEPTDLSLEASVFQLLKKAFEEY